MSDAVVPDRGAYCRQVETYLCKRNGGHLIRIVGPAFERVSAWFERGVPLKIVFRGVDRYVERQEARGGRRRPARIEFCEGDVLDAFDEWRRAVGALARAVPMVKEGPEALFGEAERPSSAETESRSRGPSLPMHLERVQLRLTSLLAKERWPEALRTVLEDAVRAVDGMRSDARGARGDARARLLAQLNELDAAVVEQAWATRETVDVQSLRAEASAELAAFRARLSDEQWTTIVDAAAKRIMRERLGLPTLTLE